MSKIKIIRILLILILVSGSIFESSSGEKKQLISKRPENFTEGVWIKKYPSNFACFKFETPDGIKIICDPFNMDETVSADIVIESHQHGDHTDTSKITGNYKLFQSPGEFEEKGIRITGIGGSHEKGDADVTNTIFVFDINGIKIAHFASQGDIPNKKMWAKLEAFKGIDILLVQAFKNPETKEIKMILEDCYVVFDRLNPKIIIPEHGRAEISKDIAKHYNTSVEYINYDGFVITKEILKNIKGHRILDMDNNGPVK